MFDHLCPRCLTPRYPCKCGLYGLHGFTKSNELVNTNSQPAPKESDHPRVADLVANDIKSIDSKFPYNLLHEDTYDRDEFGYKKYGMYLHPFNGRDALTDAYQEMVDGMKYTRQDLYQQMKETGTVDIEAWDDYIQMIKIAARMRARIFNRPNK